MSKQDWKIRDISPRTIEVIRENAKAYGMRVGEYLDSVFLGPEEIEEDSGQSSWRIDYIDRDIKRRLKAVAKRRKMSLPRYFRHLYELDLRRSKVDKFLEEVRGLISKYENYF